MPLLVASYAFGVAQVKNKILTPFCISRACSSNMYASSINIGPSFICQTCCTHTTGCVTKFSDSSAL